MNQVIVTNASVISTQVTVQNVIIGKRQLTQRVFKQIQIEKVFNVFTGGLKGEVWGYVNYFWKENESRKDHVKHILWVTQQGELRRDFIDKHTLKLNRYDAYIIHHELYSVDIKKESNNLFINIQLENIMQKFLDGVSLNIKFEPIPLVDGINILESFFKNRSSIGGKGKEWNFFIHGDIQGLSSDYHNERYLDEIKKEYPEQYKSLIDNIEKLIILIKIGHQEYIKKIHPTINYDLNQLYNTLPQLYIAV